MLRVNCGTLVVPPFECAWLTGNEYTLRNGSGCITFGAKGETDVTIILKPTPGAKRLQPLLRSNSQGPQGQSVQGEVEPNYTVIIGSHRNSCLKIEKNGATCCMVHNVPASKVSNKEFSSFWLDYNQGVITVGTGDPCPESVSYQWKDPEAIIPNIQHIGLSCWDRHVGYRNIHVLPACRFTMHGGSAVGMQEEAVVPPLFEICSQTIVSALSAGDHAALSPCEAAQVAELLLPTTRQMYRTCLDHMARNFQLISSGSQGQAFCRLSPDILADLLAQNTITVSEKTIFDAVLSWAQAASSSDGAELAGVDTVGGDAQSAAAAAGRPSRFSSQNGCVDVVVSLPSSSEHKSSAQQNLASRFTEQSWGSSDSCDASTMQWSAPLAEPMLQTPCSSGCSEQLRSPSRPASQLPADSLSPLANLAEAMPGPATPQSHACGTTTDAACTSPAPSSEGSLTSASSASLDDTTEPHRCDHHVQGQTATPNSGEALAVSSLECSNSHSCSSGERCHRDSAAGASSCYYYSWEQRPECDVARVMSLIRYPLMNHEELGAVLCEEVVRSQPQVLQLVREALEPTTVHGGGAQASTPTKAVFSVENKRLLKNGDDGFVRYQRRSLPLSEELMYVCDGDHSGVLHFIGTHYGTQEWMNPALAKRVTVKASSPPARHTDPKAIVGTQFLRTNFAGPRYVNGSPQSWWMVDLGPEHQLIVNYYTIRHDGSSDYLRNWALQGSSDGEIWVDLQHHVSDGTIKKPGQYASWPVVGPAAVVPYRAFRLLLTGATASRAQPYNLCLTYLELYGYLHRNNSSGSAGSGELSSS